MIIAPTPSNYLLRATGEAAELITSLVSPRAMADIESVVVVSKDYNNDIEPVNELTNSIELLKDGLGVELQETIEFNPLYVPCSDDQLDSALEQEAKNGMIQFAAMNGNPFTLKRIELELNGEKLINASVFYHEFDLPAYEEIIDNQKKAVLN